MRDFHLCNKLNRERYIHFSLVTQKHPIKTFAKTQEKPRKILTAAPEFNGIHSIESPECFDIVIPIKGWVGYYDQCLQGPFVAALGSFRGHQ